MARIVTFILAAFAFAGCDGRATDETTRRSASRPHEAKDSTTDAAGTGLVLNSAEPQPGNSATSIQADDIWSLRRIALTGIRSKGLIAKIGASKPLRTVTVAASRLGQAIDEASCGDLVVVLAGSVETSLNFTQTCAESRPLIVKAQTPLSVRLTSRVEISGSGVAISGFEVDGSQVTVTGAGRNRISGMLFRNSRTQSIWINQSAQNEIAYNEFANFANHAVTVSLDAENPSRSAGNWLHHNYVHDVAIGSTPVNGKEAFRVLTDAFSKSFTVIEYNLMQNVFHPGEPEAISIKSSRVVVLGNTLVDDGAEFPLPAPYNPAKEWKAVNFTNRNGMGNVYAFNHFVQNGPRGVGLEIFGEDNVVFRNSFHGGSLLLSSGSTSSTVRCAVTYALAAPCLLLDGVPTVAHVAATRAKVVGNKFLPNASRIGEIQVGSHFWRTATPPDTVLPAVRTHLKFNNVKAKEIYGSIADEVFSDDAEGSTIPPLTPSTVGPAAAPSGYR